MAGLKAVKVGDGAHDMVILGHHHTLFDSAAQGVGGGLGHLPSGLARRHQQHPALKAHFLQRPLHGGVRLHGGDGLLHDAIRLGTQCFVHINPPKNLICFYTLYYEKSLSRKRGCARTGRSPQLLLL